MKASQRTRNAVQGLQSAWVVRAANLAIENRVETLVERLDKAVGQMTDGFFPELVSMLGLPEDLSSIGARRWKPLSLRWIKRKGHANFCAYTSQPGKHGGRVKAPLGYGRPLLPALQRTSYQKAFGKPTVTLLDSTSIRNARNRNVITKLKLEISLFPEIRGGAMQQGAVENAMARRGAISARNRQKLKGREPNHVRPVIVPMMNFYTRVKLPQLLRDVLRARVGSTLTIRRS